VITEGKPHILERGIIQRLQCLEKEQCKIKT
jgi:hypothetical protein